MLICYVDECGDAEAFIPGNTGTTPVFALLGMAIPTECQRELTRDFLDLKREYEPSLRAKDTRLSELLNFEIKGKNLRNDLKSDSRKLRRRANRVLDATLKIATKYDAALMGKVIVKTPVVPPRGSGQYAKSVSDVSATFASLLQHRDRRGLMILDARTKSKNEGIVHGMTTRRLAQNDGSHDRIIESPVFGHSNTLLPLQIVDIIVSAIIYPMACANWGPAEYRIPAARDIADTYADRIKLMGHEYQSPSGAKLGGVFLFDQGSCHAGDLYSVNPPHAAPPVSPLGHP